MTDDPFAERPAPRFLHVLNGDSVRGTLEGSDVPGTLAVWADVLHDGPVPPFDVGEARWREIRADFHGSGDDGITRDEALRIGERWDALLATAPEHDETVIWLEHDLFDQLLLIRHLAWFSERPAAAPPVRLQLICIGAWPGMPDFKGLGELGAAELASLLGTRQRVTERQLALGRRAWRAFTGTDPRAVERFVDEEDTSSLPFLAAALRRNLEELPATRDGLARTDRQILALVDGGVTALGALFRRLHAMETNFYIGDRSFLDRLRALAAEPRPLIRLALGTPRWFDGGTAELTDDGRAVLAGRADAVALRGIDVWWGGAHLAGHDVAWRWDPEAGRVVASG